ncbi:MAG: hypothetical protein KGS48_08035, partial [Bacteroidetes bacterium]|nr:hypothetical protein [Bacteroidota bacterium]
MKLRILPLVFCLILGGMHAQNRITGNLQSNGNFFISDPKIGATGTPQYDYQKFGAESWVNLNYSNWGFDLGLRFDVFNNSNLLNPQGSFSGQGIGRWFIKKKIDKFEATAGFIYDQIGSGIIFRAYEERTLLIDNALIGVKAGYNFNENWRLRAFTGHTKRQFGAYDSNVRGLALDGFIKPDSTKAFTLAPGIGVVARTFDDETVNKIVNTIAGYTPQDSIGAQYNTYAATLYNTMTAGDFTWYLETAFKTKDVMTDILAPNARGGLGKLINSTGYTVYSSLSYAKHGLGITLELKRTKDFAFRNTPFLQTPPIQGPINYLPPMARQNTYRLTARFTPQTQEIGEQALQLDMKYKLNKKLSVGINFSDISTLNGRELYREIAPEFTYKQQRKWQIIGGVQLLHYYIQVYQGKNDSPDESDPIQFLGGGKEGYVDGLTPYTEFLYKFTPKQSVRIEAQYLLTDDEYGSWFNALAEFGWAPHWLIYVSDMYKVPHQNPEKYEAAKTKYDGLHYPAVGLVYTQKANRFSLSYVKQVEGINCAGG